MTVWLNKPLQYNLPFGIILLLINCFRIYFKDKVLCKRFFFINLFIFYSFIFGCVGSLLLRTGFL